MENKQLQKNLGAAAALSTVVGMVIGLEEENPQFKRIDSPTNRVGGKNLL